VKIVGGSLSIDQVAAQLQRVVSSKWNWEPVAHEKDSFVVPFSSKNEMQRAMAFGGADVREKVCLRGCGCSLRSGMKKMAICYLGVNMEVFDIGSIDEGNFYVKFHLRNKNDGFRWVLVAVYGAAQDEFKESFLAELV
jgi:hypothetical protein